MSNRSVWSDCAVEDMQRVLNRFRHPAGFQARSVHRFWDDEAEFNHPFKVTLLSTGTAGTVVTVAGGMIFCRMPTGILNVAGRNVAVTAPCDLVLAVYVASSGSPAPDYHYFTCQTTATLPRMPGIVCFRIARIAVTNGAVVISQLITEHQYIELYEPESFAVRFGYSTSGVPDLLRAVVEPGNVIRTGEKVLKIPRTVVSLTPPCEGVIRLEFDGDAWSYNFVSAAEADWPKLTAVQSKTMFTICGFNTATQVFRQFQSGDIRTAAGGLDFPFKISLDDMSNSADRGCSVAAGKVFGYRAAAAVNDYSGRYDGSPVSFYLKIAYNAQQQGFSVTLESDSSMPAYAGNDNELCIPVGSISGSVSNPTVQQELLGNCISPLWHDWDLQITGSLSRLITFDTSNYPSIKAKIPDNLSDYHFLTTDGNGELVWKDHPFTIANNLGPLLKWDGSGAPVLSLNQKSQGTVLGNSGSAVYWRNLNGGSPSPSVPSPSPSVVPSPSPSVVPSPSPSVVSPSPSVVSPSPSVVPSPSPSVVPSPSPSVVPSPSPSVVPSPSPSGFVDDKWYILITKITEYGEVRYDGMTRFSGQVLNSRDPSWFSEKPLSYENPVTGEEEVYGSQQILVIAGPFDTMAEADAWGAAHAADYGVTW